MLEYNPPYMEYDFTCNPGPTSKIKSFNCLAQNKSQREATAIVEKNNFPWKEN